MLVSTANRIDVAALNPTIGALVRNIALDGPLPEETIADIRAALLQHKVLFLRIKTFLPLSNATLPSALGLCMSIRYTLTRRRPRGAHSGQPSGKSDR